MTELVAVVYVGDKAVKRDNVLNTRRQWKGKGASVEVPRAEAEIYFSYDDIWSTKEGAAKILQAKVEAIESAAALPSAVGSQEAAKPEVQIDTSDRAALIQGAILQLDPEKHYTEQGKPRVRAIVDVVGFSVESREIEDALKDLRASGKLQ